MNRAVFITVDGLIKLRSDAVEVLHVTTATRRGLSFFVCSSTSAAVFWERRRPWQEPAKTPWRNAVRVSHTQRTIGIADFFSHWLLAHGVLTIHAHAPCLAALRSLGCARSESDVHRLHWRRAHLVQTYSNPIHFRSGFCILSAEYWLFKRKLFIIFLRRVWQCIFVWIFGFSSGSGLWYR